MTERFKQGEGYYLVEVVGPSPTADCARAQVKAIWEDVSLKQDKIKLPLKIDLEARSVTEVMAELARIAIQYPQATISAEISYDGCYYEGDTPSVVVWVKA